MKKLFDEDIKVSVLCTAYNQEKYIRNTLEGFVNQNTNFNYEVLVHDDASTDNTVKIIEEYKKKYPKIIKTIYQKQNQYSLGIQIWDDILYSMVKGKYIATCEGDDYWCDNNKLQKQFDFMESNEDVALCTHNTKIYDLNKQKNVGFFNNWHEVHELSPEEVFFGTKVHTSSYFARKELFNRPDFSKKYWFGDLTIRTLGYYQGKVVCLPDVMSVYNSNNPLGAYANEAKLKKNNFAQRRNLIRSYYKEYNIYTKGKYNAWVELREEECDYAIMMDYLLKNHIKKKEFNVYKSKIYKNKYFNKFLRKDRIKNYLKIGNFLFYSCYFKYYNYKNKKD